MCRLSFLILLIGLLRLPTLTEAVAYGQGTSEPDSFLGATCSDDRAGQEAIASVLGASEADYADYSARAAWQPNSSQLLPEPADELARARSHPRAKPGSGSHAGVSLPALLQAHTITPDPSGIVPPRLDHPPYYATAPPYSR